MADKRIISQYEIGSAVSIQPDFIQHGGDFSMLIDQDSAAPSANISAIQRANAISIKNRSSEYFVKISLEITDRAGNNKSFAYVIWPEGTEDSNYTFDVINKITAQIIGDEAAYLAKVKAANQQVISGNAIQTLDAAALTALSASALINVRFHSE